MLAKDREARLEANALAAHGKEVMWDDMSAEFRGVMGDDTPKPAVAPGDGEKKKKKKKKARYPPGTQQPCRALRLPGRLPKALPPAAWELLLAWRYSCFGAAAAAAKPAAALRAALMEGRRSGLPAADRAAFALRGGRGSFGLHRLGQAVCVMASEGEGLTGRRRRCCAGVPAGEEDPAAGSWGRGGEQIRRIS